MTTQTAVLTECGFVLVREGDVVFPVTNCCGRQAEWSGHCLGCHRPVPEGYGLAAIVGSRTWSRDVRQLLEALGCDSPTPCRDDVLARFEASP